MSFWTSLIGGQNKTLDKNINQFGQIGGFATGLGESSTAQGMKFLSDIVSGDPSKIARSLGPEISSAQKQEQQQKNQTAQFGTRSGGNNAVIQAAGDTTRGNINNMVSSLLNSSVSGLISGGTTLLNQGVQALNNQTDLSQEQIQNWSNSILGRGITGITDTLTSAATGGIGKIPGLSKVV